MNDTEVEDQIPNSHHTKPQWARATTETPIRIGNIKEPVVVLIDQGLEINLMSAKFYQTETESARSCISKKRYNETYIQQFINERVGLNAN